MLGVKLINLDWSFAVTDFTSVHPRLISPENSRFTAVLGHRLACAKSSLGGLYRSTRITSGPTARSNFTLTTARRVLRDLPGLLNTTPTLAMTSDYREFNGETTEHTAVAPSAPFLYATGLRGRPPSLESFKVLSIQGPCLPTWQVISSNGINLCIG
ncbi:hypothetical protein CCP3SC5AM1_360004 [Gammaproteobacteria bacterium]